MAYNLLLDQKVIENLVAKFSTPVTPKFLQDISSVTLHRHNHLL
jgi:hypothetical protein